MQFKYILDKSSKKFKCPKCNSLRYVRFINNETSEYIDYNFGRCDREQECGYFNLPSSNTKSISYSSFYETKTEVPSYLDPILVSKTLTQYENNNFTLYLKSLFDEQKVTEVINKYKIGTSKYFENSTIFWQIDNHNHIHTGKVMAYNPTTGKRIKNEYGNSLINWVHKIIKEEKFNLKQCLFGLHLVNSKTKTIHLVESEKTAVIMSVLIPGFTWLATGSNGNFNHTLLEPIKDISIIAIPDAGEYLNWLEKAKQLNRSGFKINVSDFVENNKNVIKGWDLVDLITLEYSNLKS
jgi:hypothetical protein